jgi:hypothetical protein
MKTDLCKIMTNHGSDKGTGWHNYTIFYDEKFRQIRDKKIKVFELGLGTNNPNLPSSMGVNGKPGASLRGWKEFFPSADVFGADIDTNILFEEDRIKTFYCDQRNEKVISEMWNNEHLKDITFDIIIDDGLHEVSANITFLKNSYHKLNKNGIYIIEDVANSQVNSFKNELENLSKNYNFKYEIKIIENHQNKLDNNLIVISYDN